MLGTLPFIDNIIYQFLLRPFSKRSFFILKKRGFLYAGINIIDFINLKFSYNSMNALS